MSRLAERQARLIDRMVRATGASRNQLAIKTFSITPALAMQIDEVELDFLLADPEVDGVSEDVAFPPAGF